MPAAANRRPSPLKPRAGNRSSATSLRKTSPPVSTLITATNAPRGRPGPVARRHEPESGDGQPSAGRIEPTRSLLRQRPHADGLRSRRRRPRRRPRCATGGPGHRRRGGAGASAERVTKPIASVWPRPPPADTIHVQADRLARDRVSTATARPPRAPKAASSRGVRQPSSSPVQVRPSPPASPPHADTHGRCA